MDGSTSVKREWVLSIEKWKLKNKFHSFFLRSEITRPKIGLKWCASCAVSRSLTPNTPAPSLKELYLDTNRPPWETKSQYSPLTLQSLPNPTEPLSMGSTLDLTPQFISAPNPSDLDRNEPLSLSSEPVPMKLFIKMRERSEISKKNSRIETLAGHWGPQKLMDCWRALIDMTLNSIHMIIVSFVKKTFIIIKGEITDLGVSLYVF